jgi:hypothetical protein
MINLPKIFRQLVKEDTPNRLRLRLSLCRSVIIDSARKEVIFVSNYLFFSKTKEITFDEIKQVCLDCLEKVVTDRYAAPDANERISRKWVIFLVPQNGQPLTLASMTTYQATGMPDSDSICTGRNWRSESPH